MLTTQRQVRRAFWQYIRECHAAGILQTVTPRRITNYAGTGKMHNTDTRCTFCDWLDAEDKAGNLAEGLAERVTL